MKYQSFFDYLFYLIEEFDNSEIISIEEYIIKNMSKDFKISIEVNLDIDDEEKDFSTKEKEILETINNN